MKRWLSAIGWITGVALMVISVFITQATRLSGLSLILSGIGGACCILTGWLQDRNKKRR